MKKKKKNSFGLPTKDGFFEKRAAGKKKRLFSGVNFFGVVIHV